MAGSFDWNVLPASAHLTEEELQNTDMPNFNFSEEMIPRPSEIASILLVIGNVLVLVFAVCGGLATLILCTRSKFTRPGTKFLLMSMAASDCILAISSILPSMTAVLDKYTSWTLGRFLCHIADYTPSAAILVNGFCLVAIAVDRYVAVVRCVKSPLLTPKWATVCAHLGMILIWVVPMVICFPLVYGYSMERFWVWSNNTTDGDHYFCWKEDWYMAYDKWHNLALGILFFSLVATFVFSYASILRFLKKNFKGTLTPTTTNNNTIMKSGSRAAANTKSITIQTVSQMSDDQNSEGGKNYVSSSGSSAPPPHKQPQLSREERQRRTVKLIMLLIAIFLVCRLPVWIYHLVSIMDKDFPFNSKTVAIRHALILLSNVKCAINPFIYTLKNDALKFQDGNQSRSTSSGSGDGKFGWRRGLCCCCSGGGNKSKLSRWSLFLRCYANWKWQKSPTNYNFTESTKSNQMQTIQRAEDGSTTFVYGT